MECDFDFVNQKLTFLTRGATKNQLCYKLGQLVIRFSGLIETPGWAAIQFIRKRETVLTVFPEPNLSMSSYRFLQQNLDISRAQQIGWHVKG